jgi:predicted type IV restriction endonuclease
MYYACVKIKGLEQDMVNGENQSASGLEIVRELVERFESHKEAYRSGQYNEAQLREEFLNPFFDALGWDIYNRKGYASAYKEVVHEDSIRIGGHLKGPDYCFRAGGGHRSFFVEAKKPSVEVATAAGPAYQLRRYGWSAKLPVSILTDFEEFAVYDCRVRPDKNDKASVARVIFLDYKEYIERWDELVSLFSPESIRRGSLERFVANKKIKKGTAEVDASFLGEIESWRDLLARNIALRNAGLSSRELNFAVQTTIDRIVFLRICEDRGIEPYGALQTVSNAENSYRLLKEMFQRADDRYNSGLFYFCAEKDRPEPPDELTLRLQIDDKPLRDIINGLYYPDSPYEFSVLPVEILGQVYEQFLGKVIDLTKGHQAKVREKPEVRKAGGVYYTPSYIVDYIVAQTVGRLLGEIEDVKEKNKEDEKEDICHEGSEDEKAGKTTGKGRSKRAVTPAAASKLRILDPACGSGSFLLGAYRHLLDWHRDWYINDGPEKHARGRQPKLYRSPADQWRLTVAEKKRILLNNIYGVDIDSQAVEVTKLSLLLKVLEGESKETVNNVNLLFHERALPDLGNNIKCGNSLVGPDFYDGLQLNLLDEQQRYNINAFDWRDNKLGFGSIMASGGFDAVIGNPPYVNIDDTWGKGDPRLGYIKNAFSQVYNDKSDILFYFLAKSATLSRDYVSFILSRAFLEAYKANRLREWLSEKVDILEIVDFRNYQVFSGVGITTAIITLRINLALSNASVYRLLDNKIELIDIAKQKTTPNLFSRVIVPQKSFKADAWVFAETKIKKLLSKIDSFGEPIGNILVVGQGMQTGRNDVFCGMSDAQIKSWRLKPGQYYTRARNSDINKYHITDRGERVLFLENVAKYESLSKNIQKYLLGHQKELKKRAAYRRGDCDWWRFTWPLHKDLLERRKIYTPYLAAHNRFALDENNIYLGLTDTTVLYDSGQPEDLRYLLGLLNSSLLSFRFKFMAKLKSGDIYEFFWNNVSKIPIKRINFSNARDKNNQDKLVKYVVEMESLLTKLNSVRTAHETTLIERQIAAVDSQIDGLVYELYGLTGEEIALVEDSPLVKGR